MRALGLALALVLALAGCQSGLPPFGCAEAAADGMVLRTCWRNVQACTIHRYPGGEIDASALAIDPISGWLAMAWGATIGALGGGAVGGPTGAAIGGGVGGVASITPSDDRPVCWDNWPGLDPKVTPASAPVP